MVRTYNRSVAPQILPRMEQEDAKETKNRLRCLRFLLFNLFVFSSVVLLCGTLTAASPAPASAQIALDGHVFSLPEGFTIERAAGPPLVDRPIVADLDERGRLY